MRRALNLAQAGRLPEAAGLYHEVLRGNPRHFEALNGLGSIHFHLEQFNEAQSFFGEALKINPRYVEGLYVRGIALTRLGRAEEAIAAFDQTLAIRPNFADAMINRATALFGLRRFGDALAGFDAALALNPQDVIGWNNRGNVLLAMSQFDEAVESYDRALALEPGFAGARENRRKAVTEAARANKGAGIARGLCARGFERLHANRVPEALACFDEAANAQRDCADAYSGRGTALLLMNRPEEAVSSYDIALSIDPKHANSWNNRGNALTLLGRFDEAVENYDKAIAYAPDLRDAAENRAGALFRLKRGTRCPPAFLSSLFDEFSSHYDETMLNKLQYRAHLHLLGLAARVLPMGARDLRILDLGCGTGLAGAAFKELGGRLDGIDISPKMIEAARARGIYDDLILGDLETILAQPGIPYDLMLAADTIMYLGDLEPTFRGVVQRLRPGGFFLLAAEAKDGTGWEQTQMNRFRHGASYLRTEGERAGLTVVEMSDCVLRTEANAPVRGIAVALTLPVH